MTDYEVMIIRCKVCAQEFEFRCPMKWYETTVAAAEAEGETMEWTGTCPPCRKDDPFLKLLDEADIPTARPRLHEELEMSIFNTSNDLAAVLIHGRSYQGDEPCFPVTKIVFHRYLDTFGSDLNLSSISKSQLGTYSRS